MSYNQKDIISGINHKDKKAWNMVYSQFYAALCAYVAKMIPESEAVEDLVQDVFISIWEKGNTFQTIQELTHYMYRACYNNTLIYIRNNQIHDTILNIIGKELNEEDEDTIYVQTVKEEIIRQLYLNIEQLPTEQRRIMLLRIEGHSWEEIAQMLGVSLNTIKTQKSRSYKYLRSKLEGSSFLVLFYVLF